MSDTAPARGRSSLPDMDRLLTVWEGRDIAVTRIEYASLVSRTTWKTYLS